MHYLKMKLYNTLLIWVFLLSTQISKGQTSYQIAGQIHSAKSVSKVYLYQMDKGRKLLDSATIVDGKFSFKGQTAVPIAASVQVKGIRKSQDLYLENAVINLQLYESWNRPNIVIGGLENSIKKGYELDSQYLQDTLSKIGRNYEKADEEGKVSLGLQMQGFNSQLDSIRTSYLAAFPQSLAVLDWYRPYLAVMNYNQLEELHAKLDKRLEQYSTYQELLKSRQEKKSQYLVGQQAPAVTSKTSTGKTFKLEQLRGKLVLLDFWASWCAPCRIANRKLVATYQQYKDKGFEVVSYSMDNKEKLWLDAIQKDGIPWIQVSDLTGFDNNTTAQSYYVKQLPTLFLIDENGTVVQQHIDHEELLAYLKKKYDHN